MYRSVDSTKESRKSVIIKVQTPETIETSSVSFSDAPKPEAFLLHALTFSTFSAPRMNAKKAVKATHAHGIKVRLLSPNHRGIPSHPQVLFHDGSSTGARLQPTELKFAFCAAVTITRGLAAYRSTFANTTKIGEPLRYFAVAVHR